MSNKSSNLVPPLPKTIMATVENIMMVVPCSEYEAVEALKECVMDPNEAVMLLLERGAFQEVKIRKQKEKKVPNFPTNDAAASCSQFPGGAPTRTHGHEFVQSTSCRPQTRAFQAAKNKQLKIQEMPKSSIMDAAESSSNCSPSTSNLASHMPQPLSSGIYPCFACPEFDPFPLSELNDHNREDHQYFKEKCNICFNVFASEKILLEHKKSFSHGFKNTKKDFLCIHCKKSKAHNSVKELRDHTWSVHGKYNYRCKLCKNLFETRRRRDVHKSECSIAKEESDDDSDSESESDISEQ